MFRLVYNAGMYRIRYENRVSQIYNTLMLDFKRDFLFVSFNTVFWLYMIASVQLSSPSIKIKE